MTLDILCKVVDNYGDIGFVYRLAKALRDVEPGIALRLHVDDLAAFSSLCRRSIRRNASRTCAVGA